MTIIRVNESRLINPDLILEANFIPDAVDVKMGSDVQGEPYPSLTLSLTKGENIILKKEEAVAVWDVLRNHSI